MAGAGNHGKGLPCAFLGIYPSDVSSLSCYYRAVTIKGLMGTTRCQLEAVLEDTFPFCFSPFPPVLLSVLMDLSGPLRPLADSAEACIP